MSFLDEIRKRLERPAKKRRNKPGIGLKRKKGSNASIPTTANAVLNKPDEKKEHGGTNESYGFGCHGCGGCGCGGDCGGGCGPCH